MSNFYERKLVRTGREHRCEYCGGRIPKGTKATAEWGCFDGQMFRRYACPECGPYLEGFWEYVDGESWDIAGDFAEFKAFEECEGRGI